MSRILLLLSYFFNLKDKPGDVQRRKRGFSFRRHVQTIKRFFRGLTTRCSGNRFGSRLKTRKSIQLAKKKHGPQMKLAEFIRWIKSRNSEPEGIDVCGKMNASPIPAPRLSLQQDLKNLDITAHKLPDDDNTHTRKLDSTHDRCGKVSGDSIHNEKTEPKCQMPVLELVEPVPKTVEEPDPVNEEPQSLESYNAWIKTRNSEVGGADVCGRMTVSTVSAPRLTRVQDTGTSDNMKNRAPNKNVMQDFNRNNKSQSSIQTCEFDATQNQHKKVSDDSTGKKKAVLKSRTSVSKTSKAVQEPYEEPVVVGARPQDFGSYNIWIKSRNREVGGVDVCGKVAISPIVGTRPNLQNDFKNSDDRNCKLSNSDRNKNCKSVSTQDQRRKNSRRRSKKQNASLKTKSDVAKTTESVLESVEKPVMANSRPQQSGSYKARIRTKNSEVRGSDDCGKAAIPHTLEHGHTFANEMRSSHDMKHDKQLGKSAKSSEPTPKPKNNKKKLNKVTQMQPNNIKDFQGDRSSDLVHSRGSGQNFNNVFPIYSLSQLCTGKGMTYEEFKKRSADTTNSGSQMFHTQKSFRESSNFSRGRKPFSSEIAHRNSGLVPPKFKATPSVPKKEGDAGMIVQDSA